MFTIKCYTSAGRSIIRSAESFTILRADETGEAEITLHQHHPLDDCRIDIVHPETKRGEGWPPTFEWAFIENDAGRTVETIRLRPSFASVSQPKSGPAG